MWTSFLAAMGGVLAIGLLGFVVAWQAAAAARARPGTPRSDLDRTLARIERDLHHARELARSSL